MLLTGRPRPSAVLQPIGRRLTDPPDDTVQRHLGRGTPRPWHV